MRRCVAALLGSSSREVSVPQSPPGDPQLQRVKCGERAVELEPRGRAEIWNRSTVKTGFSITQYSFKKNPTPNNRMSSAMQLLPVAVFLNGVFFFLDIFFPFCFLCPLSKILLLILSFSLPSLALHCLNQHIFRLVFISYLFPLPAFSWTPLPERQGHYQRSQKLSKKVKTVTPKMTICRQTNLQEIIWFTLVFQSDQQLVGSVTGVVVEV